MKLPHPVFRTSPISGEVHNMTITMDENDFFAWKNGDKLIQEALPYLTVDEREFLVTGIPPAEWEKMLGKEDPDYDGS